MNIQLPSDPKCADAGADSPLPALRRRGWLRGAAACAVVGLASIGSRAWANGLRVGEPAPPLVLHTLDGRSIATGDLRGQVVIATFWATWCAPCREELPLLSAYAARHAADGLQVLGFSLDGADKLNQVRAVAASLSFPVGLLPSPWVPVYGRIWRLPVSFVIDRAGRLADDGWRDDPPEMTAERLRRVVDPLLANRS
ncbi:MAG: TlpA disulfide reductase family protein [Burkholderiaceae bacterium]|jgi:peroxiredoxin|nr:MAG: TlpA disulfide reductase family protein [Burkholderiaceae bacterium]